MNNNIILIISNDNYFQPDYLSDLIKITKISNSNILKVFILRRPSKLQNFLISNLFRLKISEFFKLCILKFCTSYINNFLKLKIKNFSSQDILIKNRINFKFIKNVNEKKIYQKLLKFKPLIINTADQIIIKKIIKMFNYKIYNIHLSLLPKYAGRWTMFQQMANNEKFTGITLHKINIKVDTGKIIKQKKIILQKNYSLFENQLNCYKQIPNFLKNSLRKNFVVKKKIDKRELYHFPNNHDWYKFRKKKCRII